MPPSLQPKQKILLAGAHGMVGSALTCRLQNQGFCNLLTPARSELDFVDQRAVQNYLFAKKPDCVIIAAAKVGGIYANMTSPAEFCYENLMIGANLIHASFRAGVSRLLYLGSTCIYPRLAKQPIQESSLLTAPLEPTNEAYALAKIAGVKLCSYYRQQYGCRYVSAMPTNLYGPGDNFNLETGHVLPALLRRFYEAKVNNTPSVTIWGTGKARREFLFVEDLADALLFLLEHYDHPEPINIGSGHEVSIQKLAELVAEEVGYKGDILNDLSKPDGTPRKKCDLSRLTALGWKAKTPLREGIRRTLLHFEQLFDPAH